MWSKKTYFKNITPGVLQRDPHSVAKGVPAVAAHGTHFCQDRDEDDDFYI